MLVARMIWSKGGLLVAAVFAAGLMAIFAAGGKASANEPNGAASCVGQEAAAISPPGSSEEVPGGMPEFMAFIKSLPGTPGSSVKFIASLHEGSHEDCDAALGG